MKAKLLIVLILAGATQALGQQYEGFQFDPEKYVAYQAKGALTIDGILSEESWQLAGWTHDFIDIQGDQSPKPLYQTRVKMLWDDQYLYIAAELEEPHVWATYTERDAVIFHENDFEVFIDPDGDSHNYYELEINALGTIWDLILLKPYRDGGPAMNAWDIRGLKSGVHIDGTLNDPSDVDRKWSIELAFPWKLLKEAAKGRRKPKDGEQWRMNFSRVHWKIAAKNGVYEKEINPTTGKTYPEFNWVWSEQGKIALHQPETWGYVRFSDTAVGEKIIRFEDHEAEEIQWSMYNLYYAQRSYFEANKRYAITIDELTLDSSHVQNLKRFLTIETTSVSYIAFYRNRETKLAIDHQGKNSESMKKRTFLKQVSLTSLGFAASSTVWQACGSKPSGNGLNESPDLKNWAWIRPSLKWSLDDWKS